MGKVQTQHILKELRALFTSNNVPKPINAYIVMSNDAHMSEYTAVTDRRRGFISGFHGSAGTAIITTDNAYLWTDGRYHSEAEAVLDDNWTLMKDGLPSTPTILKWLEDMPPQSVVGTDPKFLPYNRWKSFQKALKRSGSELVSITENLVDIVWEKHGKPTQHLPMPYIYDLKYSGKTWQDKIDQIRELMVKEKTGALFISCLDEIAWLFNLRGNDIHCCPVFKAFSIVTCDQIYLFIDETRLSKEVCQHLNCSKVANSHFVTIKPYSSALSTLKEINTTVNGKILGDISTPAVFVLGIPKGRFMLQHDLVKIAKAVKNSVEIANIRLACDKDAACLCQLYGTLATMIHNNEKIDEFGAAELLIEIRKKVPNYVMNSFDTISSVGVNSTVIHYMPASEGSMVLDSEHIYLCDAGAQYLEGTTDITRTLHFGHATEHEKEVYTCVLKSHIALATSVFPEGTKGDRLDSFARGFLWKQGMEYLHGTGHGIGMFLNVHEGPQSISYSGESYKLEAGNLMSNEPGFYETGNFGVRIENMVLVHDVTTKTNFNGLKFLGFETISLIPLHRDLIDKSLLTPMEVKWVNDYHEQCLKHILPELRKYGFEHGIKYLETNTVPL